MPRTWCKRHICAPSAPRDRFIADSNLRAWLFKILSNTAISRFRHLSHEQGDTSLDDMGEFELYGQASGSRGGLGESAEEGPEPDS